MTVAEFMALPDDGVRHELVRGELRTVPPADGPAGLVAGHVLGHLSAHAHERGVGLTLGGNVSFAVLEVERTARTPDVAFIRAERLPPGGIGPGPLNIAPDLAVEVVAQHESAAGLEEKMIDYRDAGTPLIWVVDPRRRFVTVHPRGAAPFTLRVGDELTGGDVLPDFRCAVADLFKWVAPA